VRRERERREKEERERERDNRLHSLFALHKHKKQAMLGWEIESVLTPSHPQHALAEEDDESLVLVHAVLGGGPQAEVAEHHRDACG